MRRYVIVALIVAVVVLAVVFFIAGEDTNVPFLYGLF